MTATHYDLWLLASDRVYRAVPYEVIADWLQQGRVLPTDRLRPQGAPEWRTVEEVPTLAVYVPRKATVKAANDRAEALEPVELGIVIRRPKGEEDDDVDMIPLIDISLVLLIFFMMTSSVAVGGAGIRDVPETKFATLTADRGMIWVGVDRGASGEPIFSLGEGTNAAADTDTKLSQSQMIERLKSLLEGRKGVTVRVAAHRRLTFEQVRAVTAELTKLKSQGIGDIKAEVAERAP